MRAITKKAVDALLRGEDFRLSNTEVKDGQMFLFGNMIAEKIGNSIYIDTTGWWTRTTIERLNGFGGPSIHTKKGKLYRGSELWDGKRIKL